MMLQSSDGAFEVENLPERDSEIQKSDATHSASHPTRRNHRLQTLYARLARSIQQKIIIAPIADAPHPMRPPRQHSQEQPDLEAKDDVKNNAKSCLHVMLIPASVSVGSTSARLRD